MVSPSTLWMQAEEFQRTIAVFYRREVRQILRRILFGLPILLVALLAAVVTPQGLYRYLFDKNFQVVVAGEVFRSAQPQPADLDRWANEYGIKSVLNLRGSNADEPWYQAEKEAAQRLGLYHHDLRMHSEQLPPSHILKQLVTVLQEIEKPVLVHCKGGVHRSGLAGSAALLLVGAHLDVVKDQYSVSRGFLKLIDDSEVPNVVVQYQTWLGAAAHSASAFTEWVEEHYVPYFYSANLTLLSPLAKLSVGQSASVKVQVTNTSRKIIMMRAGDGPGVRVGSRWFERDAPHFMPGTNNWLGQSRETSTTKRLDPGESVTVTLVTPVMSQPGEFDLVIDLVDEHVTWFENMGSTPLVIPVSVATEA